MQPTKESPPIRGECGAGLILSLIHISSFSNTEVYSSWKSKSELSEEWSSSFLKIPQLKFLEINRRRILSSLNCSRIWSVSYTHLDVYKRQRSDISCRLPPWYYSQVPKASIIILRPYLLHATVAICWLCMEKNFLLIFCVDTHINPFFLYIRLKTDVALSLIHILFLHYFN